MSGGVKAWRCKAGHTMGYVARDGSGVANLLLLREALAEIARVNSSVNQEIEVMAVVVGRVVDVRCSICGRMRTWVER